MIQYFKIALLFPMAITVIVALIVVPVLSYGNTRLEEGGIVISYGWIWPTPGYTYITSPFGRRNSPTAGASSYHQGVDIAARQGTQVLAIASGTVTFAGWSNSGGYMIIINHGNETDSRYCHLDEELLVQKGDSVYAGQMIAAVGPKYVSNGKLNGATTGVHLHLGIRQNGTFVNPLSILHPQ